MTCRRKIIFKKMTTLHSRHHRDACRSPQTFTFENKNFKKTEASCHLKWITENRQNTPPPPTNCKKTLQHHANVHRLRQIRVFHVHLFNIHSSTNNHHEWPIESQFTNSTPLVNMEIQNVNSPLNDLVWASISARRQNFQTPGVLCYSQSKQLPTQLN